MKLGINANENNKKSKETTKNNESKKTDDETLKRFLGLLGEKKSVPKVKRQIWSNDDVDLIKEAFDDDVKIEQQQIESKKRGGKGIFVTRTHLKFGNDDDDDDNNENSAKKEEDVKEDVKEDSSDLIDEADDDNEEKDSNENESDEDSKNDDKKNEQSSDKQQEAVDEWEEGRLFVRNLSYDVKEEELQNLFKKFGVLNEVHLPIDKRTGKGKGYAHIMYMIPQNALKAYTELDGRPFQGRLLHILPGKQQKKINNGKGDDELYKSKKQKELHEQAEVAFNWNSFLIRSDTAAEVMSNKLNVAKSDLMGSAVNLAVAEATVVNDAKKYLENNGVLLSSFEKTKERSNTTIVVKNLPAQTHPLEIKDLFSKYGEITKFVMPPSNVIAIIEFSASSAAKAAFKGLAYRKYLYVPLFLEWAPSDVFAGTVDEEALAKQKQEEIEEKAEEPTPNPSMTIVVKNLNYETTEDKLREVFSAVATVRSVTLAHKKNVKTGELVSLGYGFIEFGSIDDATKAIKLLNEKIVDGRAIMLAFSEKKLKGAVKEAHDKLAKRKGTIELPPNSKLMIRNIPFEATKKDIKDLFNAFGVVKTVRLPKSTLHSRGFGFVEMLTVKDAQNAKEALSNTHLYGRHLVIEYADDKGLVKAMKENQELQERVEAAEAEQNQEENVKRQKAVLE